MSSAHFSSFFTSSAMPPFMAEHKEYSRNPIRTIYIPDYVDVSTLQKCLEDRRTNFVPVDSSFDIELIRKEGPWQFVVLDNSYFTVYTRDSQPDRCSYKSRNAFMSLLWKSISFSHMLNSKFTEVDGLWQLEQLPVLHFVFGRDAHSLRSNYLIDDNTICEFYEGETEIDMPELAAIAQRKSTCVSHFFVVNRGLKYWVVSTTDPNICFEFGPSIKTRVISKLVDGSTTIQALIDENQPPADIGPPTNQSPSFKLHDFNGEEVIEGEEFILRIIDNQDTGNDSEDDESMTGTVIDNKSWLGACEHYDEGTKSIIYGSLGCPDRFGFAVVDSITHITLDGKFLHADLSGEHSEVFIESSEPPVPNRIRISSVDNGEYTLSTWENDTRITCDWVKGSYGGISVNTSRYYDSDLPIRLRLVKD